LTQCLKFWCWPWLWFLLARDTTSRRRWCDSPISYLSCRLLHVDCRVWQFGHLLVIDMHVRLRSPSFSTAQLSSRLLWLSSSLQSLPHPTVGLFLAFNSSTISFILVIAFYILENNRWMQYFYSSPQIGLNWEDTINSLLELRRK
jgi:hypothetical protein